MSSYVTESSVASVTTDLVREESLGLKIFLSCSYLAHILSSIAVTFAFCLDFWRNLSPFVASLVLLLIAWISVAAGNLTLYRTIRPRGRRALTENQPGTDITAGYCVRLLLTILPFSPVLRYAEAYRADQVLAGLEAKADSVSVTAASLHSASRLAATNDAALRAAHRASRECRRRDKAAGLLALFSAVVGAGPMAILQLFFFAERNFLNLAAFAYGEVYFIFVTVSFSIIWLAAALAHFFPAQRHLLYAEERPRARGSTGGGYALLLIWRLIMVALRVLTMAFFAAQFGAFYLAPVVVVHCALCFLMLLVTRKVEGDDGCGGYAVPRDLFFAFASFFDFVNAERGHTRLRYLLFYALTYIENAALMGVWYSQWKPEEGLLRLPLFLAVLIVSLVGLLLMQFYYFCFFPEYHNPGLMNLCFPEAAAEAEEEMAKSVSVENVLMRSRPASLHSHGSSDWDPGAARKSQASRPASHMTSAPGSTADPRMTALLRHQPPPSPQPPPQPQPHPQKGARRPASSAAVTANSGSQRPSSTITSTRAQPQTQQPRPSSQQHFPNPHAPPQPHRHPNSQPSPHPHPQMRPHPNTQPHPHPNPQPSPQPHPQMRPHPQRPVSQPDQQRPISTSSAGPRGQPRPNNSVSAAPGPRQSASAVIDPRMAPPRPSRSTGDRGATARRSEPPPQTPPQQPPPQSPPQRQRSNSDSDISTCSASSASGR